MQRELLFVVMTLLLAVCLVGAQAVQLAFKDPVGTVRWYQYEINMKGELTTAAVPQGIPLDGTVKFYASETVAGINDDGTASIAIKAVGGTVAVMMPGLNEPMTLPTPDYTITFKRSSTGKVTDTQIAEQSKEAKENAYQRLLLPMNDQLTSVKVMGGQGIEFPVGDIAVGVPWEDISEIEIAPGQKIAMTIVHTLQGPQTIDGSVFQQIDSNTKLDIPDLTIAIEQMPPVQQTMQMQVKSSALFDPAAGEFNRTWMNGVLEMTTIAGGEQRITVTGTFQMTGGATKMDQAPQLPVETQ